MKTNFLLFLCSGLLFVSCNSEPSLQKYFVEHSEDGNFISLDISPTVLNIDKKTLSSAELDAYKSFRKMNILAFKLNKNNTSLYNSEKAKVQSILRDEQYNLLMKAGSGKQGFAVSYLGKDAEVDEIVVYAKSSETGFAVVRILGNEMTPTDMMHFVTILRKSKIDIDQLKSLQEMLPKQL